MPPMIRQVTILNSPDSDGDGKRHWGQATKRHWGHIFGFNI